MKKNTVFFVEWSTSGREFDMQFPLMYFFMRELNWHVEYKCAYNFPSITSSVPDLVILSSTGGEARGLKIVNWCHNSNIPVFSSFTEGMFREKELDEFLWGWNNTKYFKEDLRMLWSKPSYNMAVQRYPYLRKKLRASGATGMDKYSLLKNRKNQIKNYNKVIGYAGFDFNRWLNGPLNNMSEDTFENEFIIFMKNELKSLKKLFRIRGDEDIWIIFRFL